MQDGFYIATDFFAGASDALKKLMQTLGAERLLKPDELLMEQGQTGDTLYVVLSGSFEVSVLSADGRKLSLNVVHKGEVLGEISLFDPGPRTATVRAREPSRIWSIKNADVMAALRKSPELSVDMIHLAGQRMRWMNRQLSEQVFLPLPARLARKILHLTSHDKAPQPVLALSQLELADFAGASREAVSKILSGWNKAGFISLTRGALKLLEKDSLEEIAGY